MKAAIWALATFLTTSSISEARTWRVNTMGTGDAPDLYAAMDSAAAFDTVLVEAGQYALSRSLFVPGGVRLVGESGPAATLIYRDEYLAPGTISLSSASRMSGIYARGSTSTVLFTHTGIIYVDHCIFESSIGGTVTEGDIAAVYFENCLFKGSDIAYPATFVQCIIMADMGDYAVGSSVYLSDVLGQVHPSIDVSSLNVNFSLDPEFCGVPGSGNYFLRSTSPCLPENNPYGAQALLGPLPMGCATVRVEHRTWGGLKALYR